MRYVYLTLVRKFQFDSQRRANPTAVFLVTATAVLHLSDHTDSRTQMRRDTDIINPTAVHLAHLRFILSTWQQHQDQHTFQYCRRIPPLLFVLDMPQAIIAKKRVATHPDMCVESLPRKPHVVTFDNALLALKLAPAARGQGAVLDGWTDPIGAHDLKVIEVEQAMLQEKELVRAILCCTFCTPQHCCAAVVLVAGVLRG